MINNSENIKTEDKLFTRDLNILMNLTEKMLNQARVELNKLDTVSFHEESELPDTSV